MSYLVLGVMLAGAIAVNYVLPLDRFASLLLVAFVVLLGTFAVVPGAWPTLYRKTGVGARAWLLAVAVAGGGLALSYHVGNPQPFCDGFAQHRGCLTTYGWAASVFVGSSVGIAITAGHLGRYRRLRNASLTAAADVDEGLVAIEGRIVPLGRTVTGPVSDEETVWYRRVVERPTLFRGYREIDQATTGERFYVQDGSGRLLVLPEGLDEHDVAEFARSYTSNDGDGRRREWSFHPNDAVTVVGFANEVSRAEYPESIVVGLDGPVIIGERTFAELRSWAAQRAILGGLIACGVGGVALLVMVLTA